MNEDEIETKLKLAAIVESSHDAILGKDLNGMITSWNPAAERIYGYKAEEIIAQHISLLIPPEKKDETKAILDKIKQGLSVDTFETVRCRKDGSKFHASITVSPIKNKVGQIIGASVIARDINQAVLNEKRFKALIENSLDAIALIDGSGIIKYLSPSVQKILGFKPDELKGKSGFELLHFDEREKGLKKFEDFVQAYGKTETGISRVQHKNKKYIWVETITQNLLAEPSIQALVVNFRDITEKKLSEEKIRYQYYHDTLTDLPNRLAFLEALAESLEKARDASQMLSVLIIDLDRFKNINNSLGHAIGDRLIQEVGLRLAGQMGSDDILARLGGDEFVILIRNLEKEELAARMAQKVLESLKPSFYFDGHELFATPSIGISTYPNDGEGSTSLLKNADVALYRAKEMGRNNYQFYTHTMNAMAFEQLTLENTLRQALEHDQFVVYFQPQINVLTGKIAEAEALLRWNHPDLGLTFPSEFINIAETTGLIEPVGAWVIRQALRQAKNWHDAGFLEMTVAVNISARETRQKSLVKIVKNALEESGLSPEFLELEITESILLDNPQIINILNQLRKIGVKIAIDDFNTGYSSLSYIKKLPVDVIKIGSFIRGIPTNPKDSAIVASIISLGHNLGMKVVGEEVERMEQIKFLVQHQCDKLQGYYFSPPVPGESMLELLKQNKTWVFAR